jgi:chemotaxis-related protein WspB
MLFLLFQLGNDRYVLDTATIVEVIPMIALKEIPRAPVGLSGLFDYRGAPVPAIDLSQLALGRPAHDRLSTRLVVVNRNGPGVAASLVGLIAERATETLRRDAADFVDSGVNDAGAPYLGPVLPDPAGMIQWVSVDQLLTPAMQAVLDSSAADRR